MSGYQRNKTYALYFDDADPDLKGLEIKARGCSVQILMHAAALADTLKGMAGSPTARQRRDINELVSLFGGCMPGCGQDHAEALGQTESGSRHFTSRIKGWNFLDDDGEPLAPTPDSFAGQDMDLTIPVIMAWIDAVSGTPGPLDESSSSGGPSVAQSPPMEPLSGVQEF